MTLPPRFNQQQMGTHLVQVLGLVPHQACEATISGKPAATRWHIAVKITARKGKSITHSYPESNGWKSG
jgi:hypothetical protein